MGASTSFIDLLLEGGSNPRRFQETPTALESSSRAVLKHQEASSKATSSTSATSREATAATLTFAQPTEPGSVDVSVAHATVAANAVTQGQQGLATAASASGTQPIGNGSGNAAFPCGHDEDGHDEEGHDGTPLPGSTTKGTISAAGTTTTSTTLLPLSSSVDLARTFFLHSNPNATRTIFLDFDGHVTSGTAWNTNFTSGQAFTTTAFDFDGNTSAFSNAELERIQFIWQRVAEDYAPFNVNVTTQDPGAAALTNSGIGDSAWGTRVAIGGGWADWYKTACGGVSYVGVFGNASYGPSFVFSRDLGASNEKYTAEAISHEAGHAIGLSHDGTSTTGYYQGQGSGVTGWSTIMGNGYYQPLTQWSKGEYSGASNTQDDLAIISQAMKSGSPGDTGYRSDTVGNSAVSAMTISGGVFDQFGFIETNTDSDWYKFTVATGSVSLSIANACKAWINDGFGGYTSTVLAGRSPNLDIAASLYSADGVTLVAASNPTDSLAASFNLSLNAGTYFLKLDGVGYGDPLTNGYSDYGSIGQYLITGNYNAPTALVITAPSTLQTSEAGGTASFSVRLSKAPTANVVVSLASSNPKEGALNISQLSFDANTWNTDQSVTVQGVDDSLMDGNQSYLISLTTTSADAAFNGILTDSLRAINTDNDSTNLVIGNANANTLFATNAKDILTGGGGADTFVFASRATSTLANFDRITDFAIGTDRLDGPTSVQASKISRLGAVSTFDTAGIGGLLTTTSFTANRAATFTFADPTGLRTFIALNDGVAGFSASSDAIVEITGYTGSLNSLAVV
jgi:hypothetical protein